jgi:hypothetical protein
VKNGELGTGVERRIIVIWEGALAELPDKRAVRAMEMIRVKTKLWGAAMDCWVINEFALKWLWSMLSRSPYRIDMAVTTRPAGFAKAVAERSERNNWPIRYIFAQSAQDLGRMLPTMPDVDRVYYGREDQRWAYGPHGIFLPNIGSVF